MKQTAQAEYYIRGRVLQISASIEVILARIILLSNISNKRDEIIQFQKMQLSGKIIKAKQMLKDYYPDILDAKTRAFEDLDNIKHFRNRVAHCGFKWNDPTFTSFEIWDIKIDDNDAVPYFAPFKYTMDECTAKIEELKRVAVEIIEITLEIERRLGEQFPDFVDLGLK